MIAKRKTKVKEPRAKSSARPVATKLDTRSLEEIEADVDEFTNDFVYGVKKSGVRKRKAQSVVEPLFALIVASSPRWGLLDDEPGTDRTPEQRDFLARYNAAFEARFPGLRQRQQRELDKQHAANEAKRLVREQATNERAAKLRQRFGANYGSNPKASAYAAELLEEDQKAGRA